MQIMVTFSGVLVNNFEDDRTIIKDDNNNFFYKGERILYCKYIKGIWLVGNCMFLRQRIRDAWEFHLYKPLEDRTKFHLLATLHMDFGRCLELFLHLLILGIAACLVHLRSKAARIRENIHCLISIDSLNKTTPFPMSGWKYQSHHGIWTTP